MLRVRVSTLEAFRRVMETAYGDEAALVRSIQGNPDPPSWQMEAGTAFHSALADPEAYHGGDGPDWRFMVGEWSLRAGDVDIVRGHQGPGLREVTAVVEVGDLIVQGTCDHLRGRVIRDTKCKFTPADARSYERSAQWRLYLLLHEADCFAYDLLSFREDNRRLELLDITTVRFWRYAGLEAECEELARQFREWVEERGLTQCLDQAAWEQFQKVNA